MEYMPEEWRSEHGGHPADIETIKNLLDDQNDRQAILDRLESDVTAWRTKTDRHSWHDPEQLLTDMRDSMIAPKGFPAADFQSVGYMSFITDDEIDSYFTQGSNVSESKYRILSYFLNDHTAKERADFLKNEYGHGGGTWFGVSGGYTEAEPGKGITLKRSGCANVSFNWQRAAQKISGLVQNGKYMSNTELDRIPNYERLILARQIKNFYADLPEGYLCPFPKELDFYYPHEDEWNAINDFLGDREHIYTILGEMQYIYENTPQEDRYYNVRSTGFTNLSEYYEGEYTLFPGLENIT
jgi:diadenosine tetraphosphatase ApaH/serine/threonine PP2A family protein phosphatase